MNSLLIKNATVVNENTIKELDILIKNQRIEKIAPSIDATGSTTIINAQGLHLLPGIIDDQVHFRQPGGEAKATIATESRAAVAGGTTSFMDMPNTNPQTTTIEQWHNKQLIASRESIANYGFFLGATNTNLDEIKKLDPKVCPGLKVFMGSSTGNMLVDQVDALEGIFRETPTIIATHCEQSSIIRANEEQARQTWGEDVPVKMHPKIRSHQACLASTTIAIDLAKKYSTDLHIFHLSTKEEVDLLSQINHGLPLSHKKITAEACMPHLMFTDADYDRLGTQIKCNPAVKGLDDQRALINGIKNQIIDIIATDHAPHRWEEKNNTYFKAPSGIPMCQHTMLGLMELYHNQMLSLNHIVNATSHNVASRYHITDRGYIREGYFADLVLVDLKANFKVSKENILYKCGWSPFENKTFRSKVIYTIINGNIAYSEGVICTQNSGMAMIYAR